MITKRERYRGALVGVLAGDALLAPYETWDSPRIIADLDQRGGLVPFEYPDPWGRKKNGTFPPGRPTDDSDQTAALAESLIACGGLNEEDLFKRLRHILTEQVSPLWEGRAVGAGKTTRAALRAATYAESRMRSTDDAYPSNGSLMRSVPLALFFGSNARADKRIIVRMSEVTHPHPMSAACCAAYIGSMPRLSLLGASRYIQAHVSFYGKIVSLCKRRGFIYQGSEIYGGLAGTWDYGHLGLALKKNIENLWWRMFVESRDDMFGLDSAILMNPRVWEASGHVGGFNDPLVSDVKTKKRYRADHLLEDNGMNPAGLSLDKMAELIAERGIKSPDGNALSTPQQFNMMFKTSVGSVDGSDTTVYLRPETAQGMFVNFKNVLDSYHPKLPFGIAQVGRNFRNEIAPRDFIFRVRELEIMEFEYFIEEKDWMEHFTYWQKQMHEWFARLGFSPEDIREVEIPDGERAHYSKRTVDFHFKFPHKFDEIGGLAYRTDFGLKNHIEHSGADLNFLSPDGTRFVPHVLEPTFGLGRHVLAVLTKAYAEDELGGETRVFLKFPKHLAPVKAAVFPLLKNKSELVAKAREAYTRLKKEIPQIMWDDNGNIGKRYRRQDEIGTPYCITIDFDTLGESGEEMKDTVTVRDRDTGTQTRVSLAKLASHII